MPLDHEIIRRLHLEVNGLRRFRSMPVVMLAAMLAMTLFFSAGCGPESRADKKYKQAAEMIERKEFGPAVSILDEIIVLYPDTRAAGLAREDVKLYRGLAGAVSRYPGQRARDVMTRTARIIEKHRMKYGRLPKKLTDIMPQKPLDPWGNALVYEVSGDRKRYNLISLGADGSEGGTGEGSDLVVRNGDFVATPGGAGR